MIHIIAYTNIKIIIHISTLINNCNNITNKTEN